MSDKEPTKTEENPPNQKTDDSSWYYVENDQEGKDRLNARTWDVSRRIIDDSSSLGNLHYGATFQNDLIQNIDKAPETSVELGAEEPDSDPLTLTKTLESQSESFSATTVVEDREVFSTEEITGKQAQEIDDLTLANTPFIASDPTELPTGDRLRTVKQESVKSREDSSLTDEIAAVAVPTSQSQQAAVITGIGESVTEDDAVAVSGKLDITDANAGEAAFVPETVTGEYGSFTIDATGAWTYSLANDQENVQGLVEGERVTETFTVTSVDGTPHNLTIAINGTNDQPVIGGTELGKVAEDTSLETFGTLTIADVDRGQAHFQAGEVLGDFGTLTIDAAGNWNYALDNNNEKIQALGVGDTTEDVLIVKSADGTEQKITVTIAGTNDAAVIGGTRTAIVTEDETTETSGALTIADADSGQAYFQAGEVHGSFGTLQVDEAGNWDYTLDNTNEKIQALGAGDTTEDILIVKSADGTEQKITVSIAGTNDTAVIGGTRTAIVTEDETTETSGALTIDDADRGQAHFQAGEVLGDFGTLTIDAAGNWNYALDNSNEEIQALGVGDTTEDVLIVKSADGTEQKITVTITGTNDAPVVSAEAAPIITAAEDSTIFIRPEQLLANASDIDGDTLSVANLHVIAGGTIPITLKISGDHYDPKNIEDVGAGSPKFQVSINGQAVNVDGESIFTVEAMRGQWEYFTVNVPADTVIESVAVRFTNDAYDSYDNDKDGKLYEDRNLIVDKINIGGQVTDAGAFVGGVTLEAEKAYYDAPKATGYETMAWNGSLKFDISDVEPSEYSTISVNADGTYTLRPGSNFNGTIQLAYDVVDGHGGITAATTAIEIEAINDSAVIAGETGGKVVEDQVLSTSGRLTIEDVDAGQSAFEAGVHDGSFGTLTIDQEGNWTYALDPQNEKIQALGQGEQTEDVITVTSVDGTEQKITVTITGTNDVPVIAGETGGQVVEDEVLSTSGKLTIADVDAGQSSFDTGVHDGTFGTLTIDQEGNWTYALDPKNEKIQTLGAGDTTEDLITVTSVDGTEQKITVTITGTNDLPVVGAVQLSLLAEDTSRLITSSQLLAASRDVDGTDTLQVSDLTVDERYGSLHDNGNGTWTFTPSHNLNADDIPFSFTVSDGHVQVSGSATLDLVAVADVPTLNAEAAAGKEDTAIALHIGTALSDLDGSETLSAVTISGVPTGATLSAGTNNGNGTWTLSQAQLEGLTITPPANSGTDFTLGLAVTATDANGSTSTTTASLPVTVTAVADSPSLTVKAASGNEDKAISLNITPALTDLDGSETLSITIAGVPTGAKLSAGTNNGDGSWTLTSAQVSGLKITPPTNSDADFQLQVTASSIEAENGDQTSTSATLNVTVKATADTPSLTVAAAKGDEDTAIGLTITSALKDLDGSESLSITIAGVPAGAKLSAGTVNANGSWTLTQEQLNGLTITPPANSDADFTLTVTATSTEAENLAKANKTAQLKVTVNALTDTPSLEVSAASGDEDSTVALHITSALTDQDGSETLAVVIGNVPTGAKLTAGTANADGSWTLSPAQLNGLGIKLASNSGDDFALTVTAISTETSTGARSLTTSSLPVTVNAVADTPLLSVSSARGEEDSAIRLNITSSLRDTDGSESLGVVIGNVPVGASLSTGINNGNGSWTLTPAQLSGLTLTPPANSDADFTLSVTAIATEGENGSSAQRSYALPVTVSAVADLLDLGLDAAASGSEDSRIALHIDAGLIDTDGSESLTLTLAGVPAGALLSAGMDNGDGSWTLTLDQLADLAITPPPNSDRDFTLTLSATTLEGASGDRQITTLDIPVRVSGVADEAILTAGLASGTEDRAIALNLNTALTDSDGSETLSITIAGLPAGASLSAGIRNDDGSYTLTPLQLRGLTVTPPANSDGDFHLSITATTTEREGDMHHTIIDQLVTVRADADAPQLTVQPAAGEEDSAIPLNIASRLTDADGSESLSITISDIPEGAVLSAGTLNADGSYTLSVDQLPGLTLTPPVNSDADFSLTVTATSMENENGDRATTVLELPVSVGAVADTPEITTTLSQGQEDHFIALHIDPFLTDTDGSETISLIIDNLPAGARLSAGTINDDGSWTVAADKIAGLAILPPADVSGGFTLRVTAVATETNGSDSARSATVDLPVAVTGVADAPTLTVHGTTGDEDTAIALDISSALTDTDGSETLTIAIAGVPLGATLSAGTRSGDGSWTLSSDQLAGLTITPPHDSDANFTLTVTATATEQDGDQAAVSYELPVIVNGVADAPEIAGSSIDLQGMSLDAVTGNEDTAIALDLSLFGGDLDGSENALAILVRDVPSGVQLSAGTDNGDGTWTLTQAQMEGLSVTPPQDSATDFTLRFEVTSTESGSGHTTVTSFNVPVEVAAVADGVVLRADSASGLVNQPIRLNIIQQELDRDGSETSTFVIGNVPASAILSAGSDNGDGSWTLSADQLSGLTITPPAGSNANFTLTVTATSTEAENQESTSSSIELPVYIRTSTGGGTSTASVTILEDTAVTIDLATHIPQLHDAVSGSITISGIPEGAVLSAGTNNGDGTWTLSTAETANLTLTPAANSGDNIHLDFSASLACPTGDLQIPEDGSIVSAEGGVTVIKGEIIAEGDSGSSVDTWTFHHNGGALTIDTLSESGANYIDIDGDGVKDHIDIMMRLYDGDDTHIAVSDDSNLGTADGSTNDLIGHNQDAYLHFDNLPAGDYTLAVGSWDLSEQEVTADHNNNNDIGYSYDHDQDTGPYQISLSGDIAFLPELTTVTTHADLMIQVTDMADAPKLTGSAVNAVEHTATDLGLSATLADSDGSEYLSITIGGVPVGAVLSAGTKNSDGSWTLSAGQLSGLTITPPRYSSGDFTLTVTATSSEYENGSQASTSFELPVTVSGSADAPILVVKAGAGAEDSPIALHIDAALTDTDGSESLGITITGVPAGAVLSAGSDNSDGSWSLTTEQLVGLTITPPAQSGEDFTLTVTATSIETDSGSTTQTVRSLPVIVNAVADALQVSVEAAAGTEDTAIGLEIDTTRLDTDGSELVSIIADGLPDGAVLSAGSRNDDGSWNLSLDELEGLTVTPPADSDKDFTIHFTATTVERENGNTAVSEFNVPVSVAAEVDGVTVESGAVTGREDTAIALDVTATIGDRDGSETTTVTISGVPVGAVLSAGSENEDGSWTLTTDQLKGLTITPPANTADDFTLTLTTVSSEEAGGSVTASYEIPVTVTAVADAPVLNADSAAGRENEAISLNIRAALSDIDGSESLSAITISGMPAGAILSAGHDNGNGSWTLGVDQLAGLTITPPLYSDSDFNLTVRVSAIEAEGDSANSTVTIPVTVNAVATNPLLTASTARGDEDTAIALDMSAALVDTDGSESLTITISGVPDGARLSAGSENEDGTWTLSADQLEGLSIRPPRDSGDDFTLTVTATSTEASGGSSRTTVSLPVTVNAVADAPQLRIDSAAGSEDRAIALDITSTLTDSDGSESLVITISEVPDGAVLSAGSNKGNGSWTLSPNQLHGLTITPPADSDADFNLTVTATSTETEGAQTSTSYVLPVSVEAVADGMIFTSAASGDEDTAIKLNLAAVLADEDGSETMSAITISGMPGGAILSAGSKNDDGTWTLTTNQLEGLTITPSHDSGDSFNLMVSARTTEGASGTATTTTYVLPVSVHAVADAPTLSASAASGNEDSAISLSISTGLTDTDGSETLSAVTISGMPDGASLSAGTDNGDGSWTVARSALAGLTLTPPANSDGDFTLHLAVTSTDSSGSISTTTSDLPVTVNAVADAPTLSSTHASGNEDATIALDIRAALSDTDGSETLSAVTISGVPTGSVLSAGTNNGNGSWTVNAAQLEGLTLTPPANSSEDFTLTLAVTSQEARGGSTTSTAQLQVTLTGVADTPTLTVAAASGDEDSAIALPINSVLTDSDGSESLCVTISGVPEGASLSAGTDNGDGTWTLTASQLTGLTVTPPDNAHGTFQLTITASSTETDGDSTAVTRTATVTVNPVNDTALITGTTVGTTGEDGTTTVSGTLAVTDIDSGEAHFTAATHQGTHGSLAIDEQGAWTYSLNNEADSVQGLGDGETATDTITVATADGTTQQISITIAGSNDAAQITGTSSAEVREDDVTTVSGTLAVTDIDSGEAHFIAATHQGTHGTLAIDEQGAWTYSLNNEADSVQGLGDGETATDTITVATADGTTQQISIAIAGSSDSLIGTEAGETIAGGEGSDTIIAGGGDDVVSGNGGNDSLVGGAGDDQIFGGSGEDVAVFSGESHQYFFQDTGSGLEVIDTLEGRDGKDMTYDVEVFQFQDITLDQEFLLANMDDLNRQTQEYLDSLPDVFALASEQEASSTDQYLVTDTETEDIPAMDAQIEAPVETGAEISEAGLDVQDSVVYEPDDSSLTTHHDPMT